jgi:cytochrome b
MPKLVRETDPTPQSNSDAHLATRLVRVWDPLVRVFHWSLVTSVAVAWFTADQFEKIHTFAGYVAGGLILFRLIWGIVGSRHARFSDFVRGPATVLRYLRTILSGHEARHIGHNPAGGAMVVALIAVITALTATGWMMFTRTYYGVDWVARVHGIIADLLILLVFFHLVGVLVASLRHKENLVVAMISGRKREPDDKDID